MPVILQYAWLALTVILTLTGLASIVDGFVIWADFIAQIIHVYKSTLRDPIAHLVDIAWPQGWPRIAKMVFDLLIVWSAFFTALRLFWAREGRWIRKSGRGRISWPLAFALGPFVVSYYALIFGRLVNENSDAMDQEMHLHEIGQHELSEEGFHAVRRMREAIVDFRDQLRKAIRNLGGYYLLITAAFVMLLFINYQIKKAERLTDHQQVAAFSPTDYGQGDRIGQPMSRTTLRPIEGVA